MSHHALKTWLHCLKIRMAINNTSLCSWSFPIVPQGNSFLSFSLDNKSSSWSVVSGQCSCPPQTDWATMQRQSVTDDLYYQVLWSLPAMSAGYVITNPMLSWALTISLPLVRWWSHGSELGKICPRALSYSEQGSCTVCFPRGALLGWEIQVGNSHRSWCLKLFISHLQAHTVATVV